MSNYPFKLYHIVAASGDAMSGQAVIGKENQLPWPKFSEDLKFFKAVTGGNTVIMGRRTFESIGSKPLPNRENFVLSRSDLQVPEGVQVFHSLPQALESASRDRVFMIGGAELYRQTIQLVDGIYLTKVPGDYSGDATYPAIPPSFKEDTEKSQRLKDQYKIDIIYFKNTRTAS